MEVKYNIGLTRYEKSQDELQLILAQINYSKPENDLEKYTIFILIYHNLVCQYFSCSYLITQLQFNYLIL